MKSCFSATLNRLRREAGLSQRRVAEELGISQALLSHYENGAREPKLEFVSRLCEYYGVTADYILGRSDERSREGKVALQCVTDEARALASVMSDIFLALSERSDPELALSAINYLSVPADTIANLLNNPKACYNPLRDAQLKTAEASFIINIRRSACGGSPDGK